MKSLKIYLFLLIPILGNSQIFRMTYDVRQTISVGDGIDIHYEGIAYINSDFYLYKQKLKPQSRTLQIYPQTQQDQLIVYQPNQDTIPKIIYRSFDSSLIRFKISNENEETQFYRQLQLGNKLKIELQSEQRIIRGFECKKAILYHPSERKNMIAEVWYCPDIPIGSGPAEISGTPGLIIEAVHYQTQEVFSLTHYAEVQSEQSIQFWPSEFNGAFFKELITIASKE